MSLIFKIFFFSFFVLTLNANENEIDSLSLLKVKKLVEKEEQLAFAYKKNILEKGVATNSISTLKTNTYLPKGFDDKNSFGKVMQLSINTGTPCHSSMTESECKKDDKHQIGSFLPNDIKVKSNLYDYYYSNSNRKYTKAPLGLNNNNVEIVLSSKEKFIYQNASQITTNFASKNNQYYLDTRGVLHYYDNTGKYKFSYDKELLVDESVNMLDIVGNKTAEFTTLMANKNILYSGQTIVQKKGETASDYVNLGDLEGIKKLNSKPKDIGKTVIQFSRRSGGMIVNGDIYTWGNNANRITTIDKDEYTVENGATGQKYPVITTLVPMRAKIYDDSLTDTKDLTEFTNIGYFSSPNRPKFVDFFSTVFHNTCGISVKGELYCNGSTGLRYSYGNSYTHVDANKTVEMLYRSTFFDGKTNKAAKIFANNQIWLILSQEGNIYRWGYDTGSGFSGNGSLQFNYSRTNTNLAPEKLNITDGGSAVKFDDITYLLTIGYRKMGALSSTGDIYIWGVEDYISNNRCGETWEGVNFNLCSPTKVTTSNSTIGSNINFESIQGGLEAFVAKGTDGKFYKIHHPKDKKIQVQLVNNVISTYSTYNATDDATILSVDFSSKLSGSTLSINQGIVWVNGKNELKGDYFTAQNSNDNLFKDSIKKIKWKKIKVIQDDNGMCGIDIYNQMYCWGIMSFYREGTDSSAHMGNTFMIPVFNTNLYDLNKDYLVAEGSGSNILTNMTSDEWSTTDSAGNTGAFFMKYPTYIGGFNYEFIFK